MDSKELHSAIKELNKEEILRKNKLLADLKSFEKYFDPVYHVKNSLPPTMPVGFRLNGLLDETIIDATHVINNKIQEQSQGSILLKSGTTMITKVVSKSVLSNKTKIKAISLAIIKNLLK